MASKVVLVTGASKGIGRMAAEHLAARGHNVFGTSRSPAGPAPAGVRMIPLDVSRDGSVTEAVAQISREAGKVDVLVSNAGYMQCGCVEEVSLAQFRDVFETNFFGTIRVVQAVLPIMRRQQGGQIIMVGSSAGKISSPYLSAYCASKFALESLCESLRLEVARFGISVSILEPSFYKTSIGESAKLPELKVPAYDGLRERALEAGAKAFAGAAAPQDVAEAITALVAEGKGPRAVPVGAETKMWFEMRAKTPDAELEGIALKYWGIE